MSTELFIARRIYRGDKQNDKRVSSPAIRIAISGIALGLAVMLVSVCIIVGFKKEVRAKVVGFGSHIQVTAFDNNNSYEQAPIAFSDTLAQLLTSNPAISHLQEYISKPGIIKTEEDFLGVILKGVSERYDWEFFRKNFVQEPVRARRFTIAGIYETNFEDYDKLYVITGKDVLASLNGWDADMVSGIELLVKDYDNLDRTTQDLFFTMASYRDRLGNNLYTRSIKDINPMIFNWLNLLDMNVWVIIILMLVVSGFTMISGLLIIILERTNMIGMLKSMGARDFSIRKVFLYLSAFLIGQGMLWGNVIALLFCILQDQFHLLKLDPATYYLSSVPVDLNLLFILLLNAGSLLVTLLMMLGPSYLIARITPARSIRFE